MNTVYKIIRVFIFLQLSPAGIAFSPLNENWKDDKFYHRLLRRDPESFKYIANAGNDVDFEAILDPMLIPRVSGTKNITIVKKYILNHMSELGWDIETDAFKAETPFGVKRFENIIATLDSDSPRRLVLACHYDSKYFEDFEFIGAIDSAVSCAMLLHLATTLQPQLTDHKHSAREVTLQFIFFDGEESFKQWSKNDSLYGSRHLAQKWEETLYPPGNKENTTALNRMDILILLDLLGTKDMRIRKFYEATPSHYFSNLVHTEARLRMSNLWSGPSNSAPYFRTKSRGNGFEDDHVPFMQRDVECLHLISIPYPTVWHTANDTKAAVDFDTVGNLNKVFRMFVSRYLHIPTSYFIKGSRYRIEL